MIFCEIVPASRGWRPCASGQKVAEAVAVVAVGTASVSKVEVTVAGRELEAMAMVTEVAAAMAAAGTDEEMAAVKVAPVVAAVSN